MKILEEKMSKDHTREKELKKYLQQIRILIPIRSPGVKKFLRDFRSSLEEYTEEHPDWTMEDITQRFGSPVDIVHDYISAIDPEDILRRLVKFRIIRNAIIIIVIAALAGISIATGYRLWMLNDLRQQAEGELAVYTYTTIE